MCSLTLVGVRRSDQATGVEYVVDLPSGGHGLISGCSALGWRLVVHGPSAVAIDRGLFGTLQDSLALLQAEEMQRLADIGADTLSRHKPTAHRWSCGTPINGRVRKSSRRVFDHERDSPDGLAYDTDN